MLRLALAAIATAMIVCACAQDQPSAVEAQASERLGTCLRDEAGIEVSNVRFVIEDNTVRSSEIDWADTNPAEPAVNDAFVACFRSVTAGLGLNG
ncbi:MAG: hypothetical protein WBD41_21850 [Rhodococcus sp. (in: high G+C Gram-positive bacteria)]